ncbi:MAG: PAS domain S-box protein [Methanoregula sp.]|nr:PAS domain S-box protein [Methanoregula sp.]
MFSRKAHIVSILLVVLIIVTTIVMIYSVSRESTAALKDAVQEELRSVSSVAAAGIDGDALAHIQPGDEGTQDFIAIRNQLWRIKQADHDIRYIYTMKKSGDSIQFIVDGDYGYSTDAAKIGEIYPSPESELIAGFSQPSADTEFTTDEWGTVLSGFSPIRDKAGTVVGIVGVDMDSTVVVKRLDYANWILFLVGIIITGFASVGIVFFERRRLAAERNLQESELRYRLLFEIAGDSIYILKLYGPDRGQIVDTNKAAAMKHGYSIEELKTMNIADLNTPESVKGAPELFERIMEGEWIYGEAVHRKKDGTIFPIEYSGGLLEMGKDKYVILIDRDISDRKRASDALQQATKKLSLLNYVTLNDIQNALFTLNGFLELERASTTEQEREQFREREDEASQKITHSLVFAKSFQNLGIQPSVWQDVNQTFLFAISHLNFLPITRDVNLSGLEIYADPLLETVFINLAENILVHGKTATHLSINYITNPDALTIIFEDNGTGIPVGLKEKVFTREYGSRKGMGLYFAREILSITGITIIENGEPGKGARFAITVPKGTYRFSK